MTTSDCVAVGSLSASVAVTPTGVMPDVLEATVMVRDPLTVSVSSDAASVTVWLVCQFVGVKVSEPPAETVMLVSPVPAVEVTVTLLVGAALSRTA